MAQTNSKGAHKGTGEPEHDGSDGFRHSTRTVKAAIIARCMLVPQKRDNFVFPCHFEYDAKEVTPMKSFFSGNHPWLMPFRLYSSARAGMVAQSRPDLLYGVRFRISMIPMIFSVAMLMACAPVPHRSDLESVAARSVMARDSDILFAKKSYLNVLLGGAEILYTDPDFGFSIYSFKLLLPEGNSKEFTYGEDYTIENLILLVPQGDIENAIVLDTGKYFDFQPIDNIGCVVIVSYYFTHSSSAKIYRLRRDPQSAKLEDVILLYDSGRHPNAVGTRTEFEFKYYDESRNTLFFDKTTLSADNEATRTEVAINIDEIDRHENE